MCKISINPNLGEMVENRNYLICADPYQKRFPADFDFMGRGATVLQRSFNEIGRGLLLNMQYPILNLIADIDEGVMHDSY
jgi:hypothetical protein